MTHLLIMRDRVLWVNLFKAEKVGLVSCYLIAKLVSKAEVRNFMTDSIPIGTYPLRCADIGKAFVFILSAFV